MVLSSPFALELVIHAIIDTSCQDRRPAVKSPADGGERGLTPWAMLQDALPLTPSHLSQPCSPVLAASLPLPGPLAAGPALICVTPFCSRQCCGLVACTVLSTGLLLGCSWWDLLLLGWNHWWGRSQLYPSACHFVNRPWTFLSLLPTPVSSRKSKIVMGNTSNAFIWLPRAPCKSWLHVRDWGTLKLGVRFFNPTEGIWMPSIH